MSVPSPPLPLRRVERRATVALAARELRRVLGLWTQTILPAVVTAVLFLAIFGGALGDRLREDGDESYAAFILPGLLVMTVAGQAFANSSTSLFQAKSEGYIEDVLTSPMRGWQLVLAYAIGGLVRAWLAATIIAALAAPFAGGFDRPALLVATLALTGLVFAVLGVITGMWAESFDQHAFVASLVITPLALVGGVFYSVERLSEPWATLTLFDPLFYMVDAARLATTGQGEAPAWVSLPVAAIVAIAAFGSAALLMRRGWRLKA
ncbi:MAG TPA: ABC transporter permease [Miltoncostaeaceae bacterium]|nr:ABC transporter permease [Miltoncostaeaceae bacterium]